MHSGAVLFQQTNFDIIEKACIKVIDNVDGPGQIALRDSLMQGCNGFGVFMNLNNYVPICPPLLDNQWLELVAKNATTEIDGVTYTTRELRYEKTPYAVIKGTYVKTMELVDSVVHLNDCRLDDAAGAFTDRYVADDNSLMLVDNVYSDGEIGSVPFVRSIANQTDTAATKSCSVRGPLKHNRIRLSSLSNATNVCSNSYAGTGPWNFTGSATVAATQVSDGILGDTCAQLIVPDGATLLSAENGTPVNGTWAVWGIHAKKVSGGEFTRSRIGQNWTAGKVYLKNNEWVCSYGIKKVSGGAGCRLEFVNDSGAPITVRIADLFCVTFATFREAIEFVNSGMAVRNDV